MLPNHTWRFVGACFCLGLASGILFSEILPRFLKLALELLTACSCVLLIIFAARDIRRLKAKQNANNKSHF